MHVRSPRILCVFASPVARVPGRPSRVSGAVVAAICLTVLTAGCGRTDDRASVRSVTGRFFGAIERHDDGAACSQLSEDTRTELESQEQQPCARALSALDLKGGSVTRVQVFVTNAKADLSSGESVFLDQGPDGWRLSAIGCQVEGGKPADRPYDCELEA
jgi:hypothetical protein